MRIRNTNEILAGSFLAIVAIWALYLTWPLSSGTEVGLGPGYVPKMLAWILLALGLLLVGHGLRSQGEALETWEIRPLLLVLGSVGYFALTVERLGLVFALGGLILISSAASAESRWGQTALLALGTVVFSVLVFVKALGLSLIVWPSFF